MVEVGSVSLAKGAAAAGPSVKRATPSRRHAFAPARLHHVRDTTARDGDETDAQPANAEAFMETSNEWERHLREHDWAKTPLGPADRWSRCLVAYVRLVAHRPIAEAIFWGPQQVAIFNGAYASLLARSPEALGSCAGDDDELYAGMARAHAQVLETGIGFVADRCLHIPRDGFVEEAYFTFSSSPLFDDEGQVAGVLQSVEEVTEQVHAGRRAVTLSVLNGATRGGTPLADALANALKADPEDVPFAILYLMDGSEGPTADESEDQDHELRLVTTVGTTDHRPDWLAFAAVARRTLGAARPIVVDDIVRMFVPPHEGAAHQPTCEAMAIPLRHDGDPRACGVIILGVSPLLELDDAYLGFFEAIADGIADICAKQRQLSKERANREAADVARAAAESASSAKDEFLAMLGHELRNPLSPIVTALDLMRLRGDTAFKREREIIERQVGHLTRLVDDLLDVSRITRGRIELKCELVEIADIIAEAIETASPLIEEARHTLTVCVPRRGLVVDGDPARLRQVFSNLLTNAAKYTPHGGHIEIDAEREDDRVRVRVRDDGPGIPEELAPRLFEPFSQGKRTLDRSQGGLGLGLSIVRSFVGLHRGSVTAHECPGHRGTEFVVVLPAAARVAGPARRRKSPKKADAGCRVLIVDDNADAAEMLAASLGEMGHTTAVCYDAPSALETARTFNPDVALLDIGLPVMDGLELARQFRSDPTLEDVRLIALTGYGQDSDRQRTRRAGFDEHFVKPVDVARVAQVLRSDPGSSPAVDDSAAS